MTRIFVLDNYDSFVYTLAGYLKQLGAEVDVVRNDAFPEGEIAARVAGYDGILISPGPGNPSQAGLSIPLIRHARSAGIPLFGVCLGHQAIAEALGGIVTHAEELMHGKTSSVTHVDSALFDSVPNPFTATRYHSLAVVDGTIPDELRVTARTEGGLAELDDAIKAVGGTATLVPLDIRDFEAIDRLGLAIFERWKKLDIVVGNAGILGPISPLSHIDPPNWENVMAINVTANFRLIRSLDPLLRASDAGRAVFITSGAGNKAQLGEWIKHWRERALKAIKPVAVLAFAIVIFVIAFSSLATSAIRSHAGSLVCGFPPSAVQ